VRVRRRGRVGHRHGGRVRAGAQVAPELVAARAGRGLAPGGRVIAYETTTGARFQTSVALTNADGSCRRTIPPPATPEPNEGYLTPAWRPGGEARALPCP